MRSFVKNAISKIKDLYSGYNVEQVKPCGVNAWWHRASLIKDKCYMDIFTYGGTQLMEKTMYDMAHKKGIGENLADAMKYHVSEIKLNVDGQKTSFNLETKDISFEERFPYLILCLDCMENPNITEENKNNIIKKLLNANPSFGNVSEMKKSLVEEVIFIKQSIIHETTHAKDFAKVNKDDLSARTYYSYILASEMNAHINEYILNLQDRSVWDMCELNGKDKVDDYYQKNNLKVGCDIPQEHRANLNEIIISKWLHDDMDDETKHSFLSVYQKKVLALIENRKGTKNRDENLTLPEIFKMIELDVSLEFLNKIEKELFTPQSKEVLNYMKKLADSSKMLYIETEFLGRSYE